MISFLAHWLRNSLFVLSLVVVWPLLTLAVLYIFLGWLVVILLASSNLPWHYAASALLAWVLCIGLALTMKKNG